MTKPIYIGDKINLKIENLSQEEISQAFKDFHIDKVQNEKISFRTFKTGENIIDLGENQINLIVTSTITPDDKNIYPNLSDMSDTKVINPNFPFGFFIGASIFIISLIGIIKNLIHRKKLAKILDPKEKCRSILNSLSNDNFPFEISFALREYIDKIYKTSFLSGVYVEINNIDKDDIDFFKSLDYYKFSKNSSYDREVLKERAWEIFNKLEEEDKNV